MGIDAVQICWLSLFCQSVRLFRMPIPFLYIDSTLTAVLARVTKIFVNLCLINMAFLPKNIAFVLHI